MLTRSSLYFLSTILVTTSSMAMIEPSEQPEQIVVLTKDLLNGLEKSKQTIEMYYQNRPGNYTLVASSLAIYRKKLAERQKNPYANSLERLDKAQETEEHLQGNNAIFCPACKMHSYGAHIIINTTDPHDCNHLLEAFRNMETYY